jgi:hypothetical protein
MNMNEVEAKIESILPTRAIVFLVSLVIFTFQLNTRAKTNHLGRTEMVRLNRPLAQMGFSAK